MLERDFRPRDCGGLCCSGAAGRSAGRWFPGGLKPEHGESALRPSRPPFIGLQAPATPPVPSPGNFPEPSLLAWTCGYPPAGLSQRQAGAALTLEEGSGQPLRAGEARTAGPAPWASDSEPPKRNAENVPASPGWFSRRPVVAAAVQPGAAASSPGLGGAESSRAEASALPRRGSGKPERRSHAGRDAVSKQGLRRATSVLLKAFIWKKAELLILK